MISCKIVFDTCIINHLADGKFPEAINGLLSLKAKGLKIYVQYSIVREIEATKDLQRKELLKKCLVGIEVVKERMAILPFNLPAKLGTDEDDAIYNELGKIINSDMKDARVILDSMRSTEADIFVTTDGGILSAKNRFRNFGFKVMDPSECYTALKDK